MKSNMVGAPASTPCWLLGLSRRSGCVVDVVVVVVFVSSTLLSTGTLPSMSSVSYTFVVPWSDTLVTVVMMPLDCSRKDTNVPSSLSLCTWPSAASLGPVRSSC